MLPEVIEHYRTLCGLVEKWKDRQGRFTAYLGLIGYVHVVHQQRVFLVDMESEGL